MRDALNKVVDAPRIENCHKAACGLAGRKPVQQSICSQAEWRWWQQTMSLRGGEPLLGISHEHARNHCSGFDLVTAATCLFEYA